MVATTACPPDDRSTKTGEVRKVCFECARVQYGIDGYGFIITNDGSYFACSKMCADKISQRIRNGTV